MYYNIYSLKPYKDRKLFSIAVWLGKHHVTPNTVTLTGMLIGLFAAVCLLFKQYSIGILLISISIIADLLDGALARSTKSETLHGKFLDSICDRMVETAWVGALIFRNFLPWWGWALPVGSIMLLLARWLAFHNTLETSFVRITRFERMVAMLGIVIIPWRVCGLVIFSIVTLGTFISCLMICKVVYQKSRDYNIKTGP